MNEEFKKSYHNLSLNDKRDQLSNELFLIGELIKKAESINGLNPILNVKNYNPDVDEYLDEFEMLDYFYEDVYSIEKELITLITALENKSSNN